MSRYFKDLFKDLLKKVGLFDIAVSVYIRTNPRVIAARKKERQLNQAFEIHLSKILNFPDIKAIQVGSNDGISNDPLRKFIVKHDWQAVLIEADPKIFKGLKHLYENNSKVTTLNLAISPSLVPIKFFAINPRAKLELKAACPSWFDQLGSFNKNNILKHLDGILAPYIEEIDVPIRRLSEIIKEYDMKRLDVLHVDAEGYDLEVLQTLDFTECNPKYIIIEHKHMDSTQKSELLDQMSLRNYKIDIYFDDIIFTKIAN